MCVCLCLGLCICLSLVFAIQVLIHKTWCGACRNLKPKVAEDEALAKYSSNLIMVNMEDDEVSWQKWHFLIN